MGTEFEEHTMEHALREVELDYERAQKEEEKRKKQKTPEGLMLSE